MARTIRVDMTDVETFSKASEGIHTVKVAEIQEKDSQNGDPMLQFAFEVIKGDDKGCKVFESFVLTDKALWKFKAFLIAVGVKCDGKIKLDLDKLIGKVCDIEVFWDEYNGQTRAKIADYYKAGKGNADVEDEDEATDDEDEEDEEEAPKKAPAKRGRPVGAKNKKKPESETDDEDEEDEDTEEDEEEEKPEPVKRRGRKPGTKAKKPEKKEPEPDDDEDDEWEEDED